MSDTLRPHEERRARAQKMWAVAMAAVALITPWLLIVVWQVAQGSTEDAVPENADTLGIPAWVLWAILLVWVLAGTLGVACIIAGGRVRRIGKALIVGDVFGFLLFFVSIAVLASIPTG